MKGETSDTIQVTDKKNLESGKAFTFQEALDIWYKKRSELFSNCTFLINLAKEHPKKKEHYIIDFDVVCVPCGEHKHFQWMIDNKGRVLI